MKLIQNLIIVLLVMTASVVFAQTNKDSSKLTLSGYIDIYYNHDFNRPLNNIRPAFIYNYNRANEVNLNLGFIKAAYTNNRVRANVAIMAGTYSNANLSLEPGVLKNVLEANVGVKLAKNTNLWLDAGIFASHIGFESAIGKDCWNITRSILAENSPYYESGAKIGYTTDNGKLFVSALLLNGWQHIQRPDGNTGMSGGLQFTYMPAANVTLNYSNFYGSDKPDSASRQRFYNNFYGIFQLTTKLGVTVGIDFASEQKVKGSSTYNYLYSPVFIARYKLTDNFTVAARVEYYQDKNGILISTGTPNGFKTSGFSLNADYSPFKNILLRVEGRHFNSKDAIFNKQTAVVNFNTAVITSMSVAF